MNSPLHGKRIVNTRALHQASDFDALLRERGAIPVSYPCIAIVPPEDTIELDTAIVDLASGAFDWLILTSANTVMILAERLRALGLSLPSEGAFKTAVIGSSTADAVVDQLGLSVDVVPDEYVAEELAGSFQLSLGTQILLPESAIARPTLADALSSQGASVTVVAAYDTIVGSGGVEIAPMLCQQEIDAIVFTSSSTVTNFVARIDQEGVQAADLGEVCIACIGPKTEATALESGFQISVLAQPYTLEGIINSLEMYFEELIGVSDGYRQ